MPAFPSSWLTSSIASSELIPSRIETSLEPSFATARSGFASPLKSPTAIEWGEVPGANEFPAAGAKLPPAPPSKTKT